MNQHEQADTPQQAAGGMSDEGAGADDRSRSASASAGSDRMTGAGAPGREREPETEVWSGRTSWKHYAGRILLWGLANIAAAVLLGLLASTMESFTGKHVFRIVLVLCFFSGIWVFGGIAARVLGCHYRLTTERLFIERGILNRTTDQTELIRVDDVRMHQTLIDRMFGLGTVSIKSTDATDAAVDIEGIAEPEKVAEAIRSRMRTLRKGSLFIENL